MPAGRKQRDKSAGRKQRNKSAYRKQRDKSAGSGDSDNTATGTERKMGKGIAGLETAYQGLFTGMLAVLAALTILCLIRAIIGPKTADRIVAVNMMGTMVISIIAILTVMLGEGYLADICIIYAMISFLAVIVLTKVYMGVFMEKKEKNRLKTVEKEAETQNGSGRMD